jgi:lipid-A-disaccharide synthase
MKYSIIAGEASGDLHGSNLIKALKQKVDAAHIRCWGGHLMEQAGTQLVKHYRDLAFMGSAEVIKNLPTILKNIAFCKQDIIQFNPDVLVLIDYPGYNLRIAKWAKKQNIKVVYYVSPQVWAWKENRVKAMKQCIDKMLVILPFEKDYYHERWNWEVTYVGHPLVEVFEQFQFTHSEKIAASKLIVAIQPGSRKQEIEKKLPPTYIFLFTLKSFVMVTVIIPTLNEAENITAVVIFAQSDKLVSEAIVVDDKSTDKTVILAQKGLCCRLHNIFLITALQLHRLSAKKMHFIPNF